ncbi:hypothetical protein [Actomonas aquatica]|uniref:Right handed beta helix domain-containing protein n=1 Tax=Actomonas aquatica TaxID=2866162 RepID=A0ABZ1C3W3_9BACT|nr:hypothetical protein [Opitutus sp. WL0086]WRQ86398.1 hypothetical protein K1X11_016400 [Opitutus sp. WL0086]
MSVLPPVSRLAFLLLATAVAVSAATTHHVSPKGAGERDGTDWSNARAFTSLPQLLAQLTPGDTVLLGSGHYRLDRPLDFTGSGTSEAPLTFRGIDTGDGLPTLQGSYTPAPAEPTRAIVGLRFPGAAHHWIVADLHLRNFTVALQLPPAGDDATTRSHLRFENIDGGDVDDFFVLQNATDVRVERCDVTRYAKKGFRYADHIERLTFDRCTADANGGDETFPTRAIPNGFNGGDTDGEPRIRHVTLIDCMSRNNRYAPQLRPYWNGDGFSSEEGTTHLTYIRCSSFDNHDGGFDDKADNATYIDCVAIGNSKGFRYWGNNGLYQNCLSAYNRAWGGGNASDGLWVGKQRHGNLGVARVIRSTFFMNGQWGLESYQGGLITATDCLIVTDVDAPRSQAATANDTTRLVNCTVYSANGDGGLRAPRRDWQGDPATAFDPIDPTVNGYLSTARTTPSK